MSLLSFLALAAIAPGCGDGSGGAKIQLNASILNGATPGGPAALAARAQGALGGAAPTDGDWVISPTQVEVRFLSMRFFTADGTLSQADLGADCVALYERDAPSLSARLECPFQIDPGTYVRMGLDYDANFRVMIDDPTNGIFTDPGSSTLLSTVSPSGGAQLVDYPVPLPAGATSYSQETLLTTPFEVADDQAASAGIDIVMHGLHSMHLDVTAGAPAFVPAERRPPGPIQLYPSPNGVASSEFYTTFGSAENYSNIVEDHPVWVVFFYETETEPAYVFFSNGRPLMGCGDGSPNAWNADPDMAFASGPNGERTGGYLGLDGNTLCWAQGRDSTFQTYASLLAVTKLAAPGAIGTISCQTASAAPPPETGTTYRSGCPPLSPAIEASITMVAN